MRLSVEFKPRDLWVGVYWAKRYSMLDEPQRKYDLWLCVVPMLPMHLRWSWLMDPAKAKEKR